MTKKEVLQEVAMRALAAGPTITLTLDEIRAVHDAADEIEQLQRKATEWAGIAGTHAGEIYELQQRVAAARALLEPLAEHDPAVREWLK